jgi:ELWxxDGT repeat protein
MKHGTGLFASGTAVRGPRCEPPERRTFLSAIPLRDINESPASPAAEADPVRLGPYLYFVANQPGTGRELWRTDGTLQGTSLVRDIHPGPLGGAPEHLTVVGDALFFTADNGINGRALCKTDGTAPGTVLVDDVVPGPLGLSAYRLGAAGGRLVFIGPGTGAATTADEAVWASDGTPAGTGIVRIGLSHALRPTGNVPLRSALRTRRTAYDVLEAQ